MMMVDVIHCTDRSPRVLVYKHDVIIKLLILDECALWVRLFFQDDLVRWFSMAVVLHFLFAVPFLQFSSSLIFHLSLPSSLPSFFRLSPIPISILPCHPSFFHFVSFLPSFFPFISYVHDLIAAKSVTSGWCNCTRVVCSRMYTGHQNVRTGYAFLPDLDFSVWAAFLARISWSIIFHKI